MEAICACDLGTTSIKVALFGADGTLLSIAARERSLTFPGPGMVEQSAATGFELHQAAVADAMRQAGIGPAAVRAMVFACQRGTVMPLAADGRSLQDAVVWMDRRGMSICRRLKEKPGMARWYDQSGQALVPFTGISKILWFREHRPDLFSQARFVPGQTAHALWLGAEVAACDPSSASFFAAYSHRGGWHRELLEEVGLSPDRLPELRESTTQVGVVAPGRAAAMGLAPNTPIILGGADGQCAGLGSGSTGSGRVMVNLGTAAGVQTFLARPMLDPRRNLHCAAHVVTGAWEMEGHTQASGVTLKWFRDTLAADLSAAAGGGDRAYARLDELAGQAPPGSRGLLFLPTMNGSSSPVNRPHARGGWVGLGLEHDRACLVRSVMEGVCFEIRWILDSMIAAGVAAEEIRIVGGGARSPFWCQLHADILGTPVVDSGVADATLAGAAVCAGVALGWWRSFAAGAEAFQRERRVYLPDPARAALYTEQFAAYRRSFDALYGEEPGA